MCTAIAVDSCRLAGDLWNFYVHFSFPTSTFNCSLNVTFVLRLQVRSRTLSSNFISAFVELIARHHATVSHLHALIHLKVRWD